MLLRDYEMVKKSVPDPTRVRILKGWLNDAPVIEKDRKREAIARELGPTEICGRGMTLPAGRTAVRFPAPRRVAVGSK